MRTSTMLGLALTLAACGDAAPAPDADATAGAPPAASAADAEPPVEATSLSGRPLRRPPLGDEARAEQEAKLAAAEAALDADPGDPEALIWVGRRLGYLGRYREAIAIFGRGVERFPEDARFRRHRGHRYLTVRRIQAAIDDLVAGTALVAGQVDEIEPDGLPNARNQPTSTLQTNLFYHLGLAHFVNGDFAAAADAYRACLALSTNPDMQVATAHWLYMTLRRLGLDDEARAVVAPLHAELDVIENHDYHRLVLLYRGETTPEAVLADAEPGSLGFATRGFGGGHWHLVEGRADQARALFEQIVAGDGWAAFGHLAAEAELARMVPAR